MHDQLDEWEATVDSLAVAGTRVCSICVVDRELWKPGASNATVAVCDFCGVSAVTTTFGELAEIITSSLSGFYVSVEESGAYHDEGEWSEHVEDIQDILNYWLWDAVEHLVLTPLVRFVCAINVVEHGFVRQRSLWVSLYDFDEAAWLSFMCESRSGDLGQTENNLLASLTSDTIDLLDRVVQVARQEGMFKESKVSLWRCRGGDEFCDFRRASELGTAPAGGASAGRLNAQGHSCFYGSTTKRGAVLELAKHAGESAGFWIGRFEASRPICYLDVFDAPELPSPFAAGAADSYDAVAFLRSFAETIRQPNDPDDAKHYLPTQIFTALLRKGLEPPEAIRFGSSIDQSTENWVVFVDQDHCVENVPANTSDLYLVLAVGSVHQVTTTEVAAVTVAQQV